MGFSAAEENPPFGVNITCQILLPYLEILLDGWGRAEIVILGYFIILGYFRKFGLCNKIID